MEKIKYFEAFLYELLKWYKEEEKTDNNDLSRLKVLKLLFLWVSKNKEKLDIFNNFVSWKLWPVEKNIYDVIKNNSLNFFEVNSNDTTLKIPFEEIKIEEKYIKNAKEIIDFLKKKNKDLINYSAITLVDITHKWDCWKLSQKMGISLMSKDLILLDNWFFYP